MKELLELDKKIFLELNSSFRNPFVDQLMMFLSTTSAWIPLYIFLVYLLIKTFRKQTWIVLLAVALTIFLADQITSSVMKPLFERLRPSHEPSLAEQINIVNKYRGGRFGFASSHAANTFGVATLMFLILKNHRPWVGFLFVWPLLIGYTRIYLGVHYPGDILAGFFVGFLCAMVVYAVFLFVENHLDNRSALHSGPE